jgi:hypothetical protein
MFHSPGSIGRIATASSSDGGAQCRMTVSQCRMAIACVLAEVLLDLL